MTLLIGIINHVEVYAACFNTSSAEGYEFSVEHCIDIPILTPTEIFEVTETTSTKPTASLSIDGKTSVADSIKSTYGATNYASHTVSVNITGAGSYELVLSGPAKLSGPSTINATAGATGANLANDTWGYAWENTNVTNANANYKALGNNIKLTGNALNNQAASFSKKLAFAAKFSEKSAVGTYHADVNLSLVVSPKTTTTTVTATNAVPWSKLVYMQDMTNYACMQAEIGNSKTLTDIRDGNKYVIAKLSDNKCWMTQNLRLTDETLKSGVDSLHVFDTNLPADYTGYHTGQYYMLPSSTTGAFSSTKNSSGFYTNQQVRAAANNDYGAYYSYNAATANTVVSKSSGTAEYDICPKGWRLPTGGSSGEFQTLYNNGKSSWTTNNSKNGYWIGGTSISTGGTFFPAAGYVDRNGSAGAESEGNYWSSSIDNATTTYGLWFDSDFIDPAFLSLRYLGFSVRCIAK